MKKAKIVLSAVALFAVVGGAFAFKAARQTNVFYSADPANQNVCSITFRTTYTTNLAVPGPTFTTQLATTQLTTTCPTITVKTVI